MANEKSEVSENEDDPRKDEWVKVLATCSTNLNDCLKKLNTNADDVPLVIHQHKHLITNNHTHIILKC